MAVDAKNAFYIKLGEGGLWEDESLREGTLLFGYKDTPHDQCVAGEWEKVRDLWASWRGNQGAATRDMNQIRAFYEADESCIFITFAKGLLYWCRPTGPVEVRPDGSHRRATVDGWHSKSIGGKVLSSDQISGNLLKVQMFRGTICQVKDCDYLLRKINDELSPQLTAAEEAEKAMIEAIQGLMQLLTWQDFELLVDLVFSASGWRRVGVVGQVQKTVDLELLLPTTGERAFVQIKSEANAASLQDYAKRFEQAELYDRMFFVWHTGNVPVNVEEDKSITLIGPRRLAQMILDAGLTSWLRKKVS